jgi:DnaK suppressor protein
VPGKRILFPEGVGIGALHPNCEEAIMKPIDVNRFRQNLEARRRDAVQFLTRLGNDTRTLDVNSASDNADRCVVSLSRESLFEQASQRRTELLLIDDAMQRIGDGSFGVCEGCGDDIQIRRLEAIPWTRYCLKCQEWVEQNRRADPPMATEASTTAWRRLG